MLGALLKSELLKNAHATIAGNTIASQNVESRPGSEPFLEVGLLKSTYGCGAMLILKSKCPEHQMFASFLDVPQSCAVTDAMDSATGSAKMHFARLAPYKRHLHQICSEVGALISC